MGFLDKAKELAQQARTKAEDLAEKAGPNAAKGLDAAKSGLDKATGGKYHDKIESVGGKVEGMLHRGQQSQDGSSTDKGTTPPQDKKDDGPEQPKSS